MKFTKSIQTSDLKLFGSLEDAKMHELELLFASKEEGWTQNEVSAAILGASEKVIDILTTTERSHPSARKVNGAVRKKRVAKISPEVETS